MQILLVENSAISTLTLAGVMFRNSEHARKHVTVGECGVMFLIDEERQIFTFIILEFI